MILWRGAPLGSPARRAAVRAKWLSRLSAPQIHGFISLTINVPKRRLEVHIWSTLHPSHTNQLPPPEPHL